MFHCGHARGGTHLDQLENVIKFFLSQHSDAIRPFNAWTQKVETITKRNYLPWLSSELFFHYFLRDYDGEIFVVVSSKQPNPLFVPCVFGFPDLESLCLKDASQLDQTNRLYRTPLEVAAKHGNYRVMTSLLNLGSRSLITENVIRCTKECSRSGFGASRSTGFRPSHRNGLNGSCEVHG